MPDESEPTARETSRLASAADRIRDSAKWLLAAFGAAGAAVVAGVSLSDLGDVDGRDLWWAACAVVVALIGVAIAIVAAGSVVTRSFVTLRDVVDHEAKGHVRHLQDPILLQGFSTVKDLADAYESALKRYREAAVAHAESAATGDQAKVDATELQALAALEEARVYSPVATALQERHSYLQVREAYQRSRLWMAAGAVLAIVGLVAFVAIVTRPEDDEAPVVGEGPLPVTVAIRAERADTFSRVFGPGCDTQNLTGTAVATEGDSIVVVIDETDTCGRALVTLGADDAVVRAASSEPTGQ
jgi:hypothetical protein